MDSQGVIQQIIHDVKAAEAQDISSVNFSQLKIYLEGLSKELAQIEDHKSAVEIEKLRAENEGRLAQYNWQKDVHIEIFKSVILSGQNALRSAMLLHGGAALALLTFIGHLVTDPETKPMVAQFAPIMICFLIGVLSSVFCQGVTYATQFCYQRNYNKCGNTLNVTSNLVSIGGYGLFGWACYLSYKVFISF